MRSPVYRNLDRPFRIFGFSPLELSILCITFVVWGEIAQSLSIHRVWGFLATALLALLFHWLRRSMGDHFTRRLIRFLKLPSEIRSKLFVTRRSYELS